MIHQIILAYCILTTCIVESTTYGLVGGTVTLNTNIKDIPDDILWKHNGNKVVEVDGQKQNAFGSFLNRITLDRSSADLTITDLSYEDSGEYVLEIYNKALTRYNHNLEVIDKVAKPTISCKMNTNSSSSTSENQATLMCSSEPGQFQSLMKFDWSSHEKSGQDVTIPLGDQHDDKVYTCTVSNPVSKESTTFTAKDCYKGDDPGALDVSIVSGIGIGIAFVILLVALLFCKLKHKACFAKGNDEERASYGSTEGSRNGEEQKPLLNQSEKKGTEPLNILPKEDTGETEEKIDHTPQRPVHDVKKVFEPKPGEQKPPVSGKNPRTPSRNDKEDTDTISESDKNADKDQHLRKQPNGSEESETSDPLGNGLEEETTSPEQKDAEATVHETNSVQADMETHSGEDNQQDSERNETVKNLPLVNSQQPQSLLTPKPDHNNTNTCQESSDTEQAASDLEEKENNSDSGSGTEETDEDSNKKAGNGEEEKPALANPEKIDHTPQRPVQVVKTLFEPKPGEQKPSVSGKNPRTPSRNDKEDTDTIPPKKPPNPFRNEKEDTDNDPADPQKANVVLPDSDKKEVNGEEEKSALANPVSPPVQPCSPLTTEPLNMLSKDDADEHNEDANSYQVTGKTKEGIDHTPQKPVQVVITLFEPKPGEQKPSVSESDKKADEDKQTITASSNPSSAVQSLSEDDENKENANSDQASDKTTTKKNAEESEPSGNRLEEETTSLEQKDAEATVNETNSTQADVETHSGEDNQQDRKHNETVKNLPVENSQQPQSLLTPEPDHINANTCQETSTEQAASDLEEKEKNSDSGSGTEETDEGEPKKPPTPSRNDKQDTDVTQDREPTQNKVSESDPADPVKADIVSPDALNDDKSDQKADEDEEPRTASANASPVVQPVSENSEHKEDANPDQDSDNTTTETNAEDSDRLKKVSNHEPVVDKEDDKTGKNLPVENSQQPQSLITPGPDHINTNTCQESSDTEQAASDLEEKENNRDSGSGTEETDEGEADDKNKVQREPEDEKSKRSDQ